MAVSLLLPCLFAALATWRCLAAAATWPTTSDQPINSTVDGVESPLPRSRRRHYEYRAVPRELRSELLGLAPSYSNLVWVEKLPIAEILVSGLYQQTDFAKITNPLELLCPELDR